MAAAGSAGVIFVLGHVAILLLVVWGARFARAKLLRHLTG